MHRLHKKRKPTEGRNVEVVPVAQSTCPNIHKVLCDGSGGGGGGGGNYHL